MVVTSLMVTEIAGAEAAWHVPIAARRPMAEFMPDPALPPRA